MNAMRRAIIHVGMPRTGSTTLQYIFAQSRPALLDAGLLYPDLTPQSMRHAPHVNHQHFGETLDVRRPRHERAELHDRLSKTLQESDSDTLLLSYEDFIHQQRRFRVPEHFRDFFARHGYALEAFLVVKPQSEYWNSSYTLRAQMMRECRDFSQFFLDYELSGRFAYDRLIEPWLAACDGRVRAVPLRDRRSPASLIRRMLDELELGERIAPLVEAQNGHRVENRSLGPVAIEISRRLCDMRFQQRIKVRPREAMRFIEKLVAGYGLDQHKFNGMDHARRALVDRQYHQTDDCFAQRIWGRPWDEIVMPEAIPDVNELAIAPVDPGTEQIMADIMRRTAEEFGTPLRVRSSDRWINTCIDRIEKVQGRLHLSSWRVV